MRIAKNLELVLPRVAYEKYFTFTKHQLDNVDDTGFFCTSDWVDYYIGDIVV